jgi:hypothetical protein
MLAKVDPLGIGSFFVYAKLNSEKTALRGRGHVHIDYAISHFKIFHARRSAVELDALAALMFRYLGLSFETPARGVCGNSDRLARLAMGS